MKATRYLTETINNTFHEVQLVTSLKDYFGALPLWRKVGGALAPFPLSCFHKSRMFLLHKPVNYIFGLSVVYDTPLLIYYMYSDLAMHGLSHSYS